MAQSPYTTDNAPSQQPVETNTTPVRQGMRGVHVLWVLIISIILAAAALFGSWAMRSDDLAKVEPNNNAQPGEAQMFDNPPAAPKQGPSP